MIKLIARAVFLAAMLFASPFITVSPASAVELQDEFDAAATKGAIALGELTTFREFLDAAGSVKLRNLAITNVKASQGALSGDVRFFNSQSSILVYGGGGAKSSFIAFEAKEKPIGFRQMYGDKAKLLDVLVPERQMLFFAVGDVELKKEEIPSNVQKIIGGLFTDDDYTLELDQGMNLLGVSDLGKSRALADATKFLGGKATRIAFRASLAGNVLDSLLEKKLPVPDIKLSALLPKFQPHIGNLIRFPGEIQFELSGSLSAKRDKAELGLKTDFEFEHAKGGKPVKMELEAKVSLEKDEEPEFEVSAGMPEDEKLEGAFGVKWLTLSDYKMAFKGKPGEPVAIEMAGSTSFGEKTLHLGGGIQVGAATAGIPVPEKLEFSIDDGPNKVGQLSIVDIVKASEFLAKENGKNLKIKYKDIPDIAITGTKLGEGPVISVLLKASKDFGFDITGNLRFLGTDIATVERAFISADSGFQLTARTGKLGGVGPFNFPDADIDIAFVASKEDRSIEEPRIIIGTKNVSLFGVKKELDLVIIPGQFLLVSKQDYGSLFTFDFAASTGKRITDLAGLAKADFILDARVTSDIGKWIKDIR